jgi:hypothetical protein
MVCPAFVLPVLVVRLVRQALYALIQKAFVARHMILRRAVSHPH